MGWDPEEQAQAEAQAKLPGQDSKYCQLVNVPPLPPRRLCRTFPLGGIVSGCAQIFRCPLSAMSDA